MFGEPMLDRSVVLMPDNRGLTEVKKHDAKKNPSLN
jgi:hypothetical protein